MNPTILAAVGTAVVAALGLVFGALPDEMKSPLWRYAFNIPAWVLVIAGLVFIGISFWSLNYILYTQRRKRQRLQEDFTKLERNLQTELTRVREELKRELQISDRLRYRDVITGLPNLAKLKEDFKSLSSNEANKVQLIMLDMDGFGEINNRFGYEKGDEVIRYIASTTYDSMRRNEKLYKPHPNVASDKLLPSDTSLRFYRRYSGGDEFMFILSGEEEAALGFLVRLKSAFDKDLSYHVHKQILNHPWPLRFHAGVCPLDVGDTFRDALSRVEQCLGAAKQKGSTCRVFWFSRKKAKDFPPGTQSAQNYSAAENAFFCPEATERLRPEESL